MREDVKKINRKFLFTLLLFLAILAAFVGVVLLMDRFLMNAQLVYILLLVLAGILIWVLAIFRRKFYEITNISYLLKIRNQPGKPLEMKHSRNMSDLQDYLKRKGFTRYKANKTHTLYFKVYKDHIKKIFRNYVLEVVVILPSDQKAFYIDEVDQDIASIQKEHSSKKQTIEKLLITQIKPIQDLDESAKEAIKEIVFVKTRVGIVSTINVGLHYATGKAVLLYSDEYSPSLYYKYHIDQIKDFI
jgi:hypothetical protein